MACRMPTISRAVAPMVCSPLIRSSTLAPSSSLMVLAVRLFRLHILIGHDHGLATLRKRFRLRHRKFGGHFHAQAAVQHRYCGKLHVPTHHNRAGAFIDHNFGRRMDADRKILNLRNQVRNRRDSRAADVHVDLPAVHRG